MNETYEWFKKKTIEDRTRQGWKFIEDEKDFFEVRLNEKRFERFIFQNEWSQIIQKQLGEETCVFSVVKSGGDGMYEVVQRVKGVYIKIVIFEYLKSGKWYTIRSVFDENMEEMNLAPYQMDFQTVERAFFTELLKKREYRLPAVTGMLQIENHDLKDLLST